MNTDMHMGKSTIGWKEYAIVIWVSWSTQYKLRYYDKNFIVQIVEYAFGVWVTRFTHKPAGYPPYCINSV